MSNEREAICVGPCKCGGYGIVYDEQAEKELGMCHKTIEAALQSQSNTTQDGKSERELAEIIRQRDDVEAWADRLAEAIGKYFDVDIGEHSNLNNPWSEALTAIESPPQQEQSGEAVAFIDVWKKYMPSPTPKEMQTYRWCETFWNEGRKSATHTPTSDQAGWELYVTNGDMGPMVHIKSPDGRGAGVSVSEFQGFAELLSEMLASQSVIRKG